MYCIFNIRKNMHVNVFLISALILGSQLVFIYFLFPLSILCPFFYKPTLLLFMVVYLIHWTKFPSEKFWAFLLILLIFSYCYLPLTFTTCNQSIKRHPWDIAQIQIYSFVLLLRSATLKRLKSLKWLVGRLKFRGTGATICPFGELFYLSTISFFT